MDKRSVAIRLIDSHAHLDEIENVCEVIARAEQSGVSGIIAVGSDYESSNRVLEMSGRYGETIIYPAVGVHPWKLDVSEWDATVKLIEANSKRVVAIGEIGLDFWLKDARKNPSKRELQKEAFERMLDLCGRHKKPAIIHARGAWEDALDMVIQSQIPKAVFHWYSGSIETLEKILRSGFLVSATPALEYSEKHRVAIVRAPLETILLETDAPTEYQGKASEPADVVKTLDAVAKVKGMSREQVAATTTKNARAFFGLTLNQGIESE